MEIEVCDIHSHVVYKVDDGSWNIDMSIKMLRSAYKQGVRNVICTSHDTCNFKDYMENFINLKKRIELDGIDIKLYCGYEVYADDYIIDDVIDKLNNGELLTINETRYVLLEFYPDECSDVILQCIKAIASSGYTPILAHTERCSNLSKEYNYISLMQEYGCLFQINAYSIVNESNKAIKKLARKLLKEKRVSFIGSDAHQEHHRPYNMTDGINYIYKNCDVEYAKDICYRNAKKMLNLN